MRTLWSVLLCWVVFSSAQSGWAQGAVTPDWEQVSDSGGIRLFKKEIPGSDLIAFKGEGTIDASVTRVASVILDQARIPEWAQNVEQVTTLKKISDTDRIEYTHVGTPFILKDRDFVTRNHVEADARTGEVRFDYVNADFEGAPSHGYVRGNVIHSAFVLKPIEKGAKTQFTGEIQADPKGSVPKWLVNFFQKSWPRKTLEALRRQCRKPDVVDQPAVVALLGVKTAK